MNYKERRDRKTRRVKREEERERIEAEEKAKEEAEQQIVVTTELMFRMMIRTANPIHSYICMA